MAINQFDISGKTVVVTGASSGIGLAQRISLTPYAAAREVMVTRRDLARMKGGPRAAAWLAERAGPWLDLQSAHRTISGSAGAGETVGTAVDGGEEVPGFAQSNQQISAFMDAVS